MELKLLCYLLYLQGCNYSIDTAPMKAWLAANKSAGIKKWDAIAQRAKL